MLRDAYSAEIDRTIADIGALTAVDGATILNRSLTVIGFGAVLSVKLRHAVVEARDAEATHLSAYDLGRRGTRHRAAAAYAAANPGAVVFVASTDGPVKCMFRDPAKEEVVMWRL